MGQLEEPRKGKQD